MIEGLDGDDQPSLAQIGETQNDEESLRSRIAASYFYRRAKWLYFSGASAAVVLALVSPLFLFFRPSAGPELGAIAGLWIFVSRFALEPIRRSFQLRGAIAQERFDCRVLDLEWNDAIAKRISEEEVRAASGSMKDAEKARDWYPTNGDVSWPTSVLVCQRANTVWARRQHRAYANSVLVAAVAWFLAGVLLAVADSASLAEYLVVIFLPSLPAFLAASELSRDHNIAAKRRAALEERLDILLKASEVDEHELREIQDELFHLRRDAPLVPEWFYKIIRSGYEKDMRYAAQRVTSSRHLP